MKRRLTYGASLIGVFWGVFWGVFGMLAMLAGCAVGPDYVRPDIRVEKNWDGVKSAPAPSAPSAPPAPAATAKPEGGGGVCPLVADV